MDYTYYATKSLDGSGGYELRQVRFINTSGHPHDVCAVARTVEELRETVKVLKGSIDWSRVTKYLVFNKITKRRDYHESLEKVFDPFKLIQVFADLVTKGKYEDTVFIVRLE